MTKLLKVWMAGSAALLLCGPVMSQVTSVAGIEGPIESIKGNPDGSVTMQVMRMTVMIPAAVIQAGGVSSPSKPLTFEEIVDPAPLPGRGHDDWVGDKANVRFLSRRAEGPGQPGFVGGTAKGTGQVSANGVVMIEQVIFEPAENVVIGVITGTQPLTVNNMPVELLTDSRIPVATLNDHGFEIDLAQATVGQGVAVEGYFAGGVMKAFQVSVTGAPAKDPGLQVAASRAQGRPDKGELQVNGAVSGVAPGAPAPAIRLEVDGSGLFIANVPTVLDPLAPGTATFLYRGSGLRPEQVPAVVRMTVLGSGGQPTAATATAEVSLR